LFYRLNVFPIRVPPLRERKEDVVLLLNHFLEQASRKTSKQFSRIDSRSIENCIFYHWPGNVRELQNLVERQAILQHGDVFYMDPLMEYDAPEASSANGTLDEFIKSHLERVLSQTGGKLYGPNGAAQRLALKPSTLQAKLKKYGIDRKGQGALKEQPPPPRFRP